MSSGEKQAIFEHVYRGRQTALHHLAYMRTGKVLLALDALHRAGVELRGSRVLGTRRCSFESEDTSSEEQDIQLTIPIDAEAVDPSWVV